MAISPGYTKDYMMTTRYWVSMTILNVRKSNLSEDLISRLHEVNMAIDGVVFNTENGYTKWARAMLK